MVGPRKNTVSFFGAARHTLIFQGKLVFNGGNPTVHFCFLGNSPIEKYREFPRGGNMYARTLLLAAGSAKFSFASFAKLCKFAV